MMPYDIPDIKYVELKKLSFAMQYLIDPTIETDTDYFTNMVKVRISGYLLSEDMGKATFKYPADWWQAVKERWFPAWLRDRFQVVYKVIEFDAKAYFPDYRPSLPPNISTWRVALNQYSHLDPHEYRE